MRSPRLPSGLIKSAGTLLLIVGMMSCRTTTAHVKDEKESEAHYKFGLAYLNETPPNLQRAYVELLKATADNPTHLDALYALGHVYAQLQEYEKAIETFKKTLTLKPGYANAYNYLGNLYDAQGREEEAIEAYRKALEDPYYETPQLPHWKLGLLYLKRKWYDQALLEFQAVRRVEPMNIVVIHQLGATYQIMGQMENARRTFEEAVNIAPNNYQTHDRLAKFYLETGLSEKAIESFQKVMEIAPKSREAEEAREIMKRLPL